MYAVPVIILALLFWVRSAVASLAQQGVAVSKLFHVVVLVNITDALVAEKILFVL